MRILFLDDDPLRAAAYLARPPACLDGNVVDVATTAAEAISLLKANRYDRLDLDHDLDTRIFVDIRHANTGMAVARWIVRHYTDVNEVIIHSWNELAARKMMDLLAAYGYRVVYAPFGFDDEQP